MKTIFGLHIAVIMASLLIGQAPTTPVVIKVEPKVVITTPAPKVAVEPIKTPSVPKVRAEVPRERAESLKGYAQGRINEVFGAGQWSSFNELVRRESGWHVGIINKSSGACGLGQALPCSKMKCSLSDGKCQVDWMIQYIIGRYGNPYKALLWHNNHNWY